MSTASVLRAKEHPQAPLVAALECLLYESRDGMPDGADKTDIRLHYIMSILRHFHVTPRATCGYRPDRPPFSDYAEVMDGMKR